jgi:hypothetical protein
MQRHVGNRLAPVFRPSLLSVAGRRSGRTRTVPLAVLEHEGERGHAAAHRRRQIQ